MRKVALLNPEGLVRKSHLTSCFCFFCKKTILRVYIFSHLSILTNTFAYIRARLNHRCFVVESHVFRGGKPCVSGWKTMCFGVKQSFVCVRAATCSCPRSYLFVPAQLPVRVRAATCSCLRSYQLKFAWRYTCCSATAYFQGRECALSGL